MDGSHIHLISNHLPIVGVLCGLIVMIYGMIRQSPTTLAAAYLVFIVSTIIGFVAYFTGEAAEHVAEEIQGVTHDSIELHEEAAVYALVSYIVLFIFAVIGFLRSKNHYHRIRLLAIIILVLGIVSFGISAYTGYVGGLIRHTELGTMLK